MEFTADQVWGAAAAAHRINEGYIKDDEWNYNSPAAFISRFANKHMVKKWLREQDFSEVTEQDILEGQRYRSHFKGYTLLAIRGTLNDFQAQALRIASMDMFTGRNMLEFAIVSCLPSVAERDSVRNNIKKEIYASEQLNAVEGEAIVGEVEVVSSKYSTTYNKYRITGRMGESFVDFWFTKDLQDTVKIKAKVKTHRSDKTTQLNYVKIA